MRACLSFQTIRQKASFCVRCAALGRREAPGSWRVHRGDARGIASRQLCVVDCEGTPSITQCHVDGITDLKFLANNPTMLLSSARYDDFKYLWDLRMTGRFVSCYHLPNSSNQRTNLELSADCSTFMTGSQAGELWIFPIDSSEKPVSWRLFN